MEAAAAIHERTALESCTRCGRCCVAAEPLRCSLRQWIPWKKRPFEFVGRCEFLRPDNLCEVMAIVLDPPPGVAVDPNSQAWLRDRYLRGLCDHPEARRRTG